MYHTSSQIQRVRVPQAMTRADAATDAWIAGIDYLTWDDAAATATVVARVGLIGATLTRGDLAWTLAARVEIPSAAPEAVAAAVRDVLSDFEAAARGRGPGPVPDAAIREATKARLARSVCRDHDPAALLALLAICR